MKLFFRSASQLYQLHQTLVTLIETVTFFHEATVTISFVGHNTPPHKRPRSVLQLYKTAHCPDADADAFADPESLLIFDKEVLNDAISMPSTSIYR